MKEKLKWLFNKIFPESDFDRQVREEMNMILEEVAPYLDELHRNHNKLSKRKETINKILRNHK